MSFYLVDLVDIVDLTYVNGVQTETVRERIEARVMEKHRLLVGGLDGKSGKEVIGQMQIMLAAGVELNYDSKIMIRSIAGNVYPYPTKRWQVKQISRAHLMKAQHVEVWV